MFQNKLDYGTFLGWIVLLVISAQNFGQDTNVDLQEVGVRILPAEACRNVYYRFNPDTMICAGRIDGIVDSCVVSFSKIQN